MTTTVGGQDDHVLASIVRSVAEYGIWALDVDGTVRTWTAGGERLTGYGADEIIGRHWSAFYTDADTADGRPERDLALTVAVGAFEDEGWRVRSDGSLFWADVVLSPLRADDGSLQGFGVIARDRTERKQGEDTLRESEERFALLVTSVVDYAIFLLDRDGTVASWNVGAERLKGYRADEIIGHHFSRFYTADDRRRRLPDLGLRTALEAGRWESEGWRVRKDGTRFWADVVITALRGADGTHRGFAKVTRDLTDRKRNEDALRGVLARERESAERLRVLDRMKTDLVAVVAHDMRGPVSLIQSLLQMTDDEWTTTDDGERRELIGRARRRADALADFVDDVFDVARIEAGELLVDAAPVDVGAVVARVVADAGAATPDREFTVEIDEPVPRAMGDEQRTWQILMNLVSNAMKFSPDDASVAVRVSAEGGEIVTSVVDHGAGIPSGAEELLFKRFSRLSHSAGTPGSGMGLYIAKSLAEAQDGRLWLASSGPEGSTFRFALPVAAP